MITKHFLPVLSVDLSNVNDNLYPATSSTDTLANCSKCPFEKQGAIILFILFLIFNYFFG